MMFNVYISTFKAGAARVPALGAFASLGRQDRRPNWHRPKESGLHRPAVFGMATTTGLTRRMSRYTRRCLDGVVTR
jgi:hypothetical protein